MTLSWYNGRNPKGADYAIPANKESVGDKGRRSGPVKGDCRLTDRTLCPGKESTDTPGYTQRDKVSPE